MPAAAKTIPLSFFPATGFTADPSSMRLFEFLFAADDLAVLSAYAAAQDLADAQRRSGPHEDSSAPTSSLPFTESGDTSDPADESCDDADGEVAATSTPAVRRAYTWVARLRSVDGIPADRLAPIHGRLIAHGLLQFQLQGRDEGVLYRVTTAGRQKLAESPDEATEAAEAA